MYYKLFFLRLFFDTKQIILSPMKKWIAVRHLKAEGKSDPEYNMEKNLTEEGIRNVKHKTQNGC